MKILVTGAKGFVGKNLIAELKNQKYDSIFEIDDCYNTALLMDFIDKSDFVFHLQTLYRSNNELDYQEINVETTKKIVESIGNKRKSLLLLSSKQAGNGSYYGESKVKAEEIVQKWSNTTGNPAFIFRISNEFGKWCPPNLNSVVATFCYNVANNIPISIFSPEAPLELMYIDDIINYFISIINQSMTSERCEIKPVYSTTVGKVATIILSFNTLRSDLRIPNIEDGLTRKLYSTYLSYLPKNKLATSLQTHFSENSTFTELLHFSGNGQVSVNIIKPGITKGNHWHHSKNEKFVVILGTGIIRLRMLGENEIIEYHVNGDRKELIDIPPGYTHNISNIGETDMLTIMWANEIFDINKPDTYFEEI